VRYLVDYPIWHDEAFVAVNFLDRDYGDLLRPLDYYQVCPLLFLWAELTVVKLLGFSTWSLRLFPTVCSLLSVVAFHRISGSLLSGKARLLAVAIFATAFYPVRHGAEVKPYAGDLLAALLIVGLALKFRSTARPRLWCGIMMASMPLLLGLSNPAIFVAGGAMAVLLFQALRTRSETRSRTIAIGLTTAATVVSFLVIYLVFTSSQSAEVRERYRWGYWIDSFPPTNQPWLAPFWLVRMLSGNMLAYPIGGENGGSSATLLLVLVGVIALWRQCRREELGILIAPAILGLFAAILGRYPFGGEARIMQYLAPSICLLAGMGGGRMLERTQSNLLRSHGLRWSVLGLVILGSILIGRDLVRPYRDREDVLSRDFARWFWTDYARSGDILCVKSDLGLNFVPSQWKTGLSALYLCQKAFQVGVGAPKTSLDAIRGERLRTEQTLRFVFFDHVPEESSLYQNWREAWQRTHKLETVDSFEVYPPSPGEGWKTERYVVVEARPRGRLNGPPQSDHRTALQPSDRDRRRE
jgi:hypothetical protein